MHYSTCGWLPFGLSAQRMEISDICGSGTEYRNGKCVSTIDVTSDNASICGSGTEYKNGKCTIMLSPQQVIEKVQKGDNFSIDFLHDDFFTQEKSTQPCGMSHLNTITCKHDIAPNHFKLHSNGCLQNVESGKFAHLETSNDRMKFNSDTCVSKRFSAQLEEKTGNMNIMWRNPYDNTNMHCVSYNGIDICRTRKFATYQLNV